MDTTVRRKHLLLSAWLLVMLLAWAIPAAAQPVTVTLGTSASPSPIQPGGRANVQGTNFPSGTILPASIVVTLEPATAGQGPTVTLPAFSIVTVVGSTRRVFFDVPLNLAFQTPTAYLVSIASSATPAFVSGNKSTLTINPLPVISLSPGSAQQGSSLAVNVTGQFVTFVQGASQINFGAGISAAGTPENTFVNLTVVSPTSATVAIAVNAAAAVGSRTVIFRNGTIQSSTTFTVLSAGGATGPVPQVTITSPPDLSVFGADKTKITVTGTVSDATAAVTVGGVAATVSGNNFTALNVPLKEGTNIVVANATNANGVGTASIEVLLDTTPPNCLIDAPSNGAMVTTSSVVVTGVVNDIVTGTVNAGDVSVMVNGIAAKVSNRSFMADNILLVPGKNTITATATDKAGNTKQTSVSVTLQDQAGQQRIVRISGDGQTAPINAVLPQSLVVQAVDANGNPMPNQQLTFSVRRSDGVLIALPQQSQQITVTTDANGKASVQFQLGSRVGVGMNQVSVTAPGFTGEVMFCESATPGPPNTINLVSGDGQTGAVSKALPMNLVAVVFDKGGNPVAGVAVTFSVTQGGGSVDGGTSSVRNTNADGRASSVLTLGAQEGINNNIVSASFQGLTGSPLLFTASGVVPGNAADTTVSGVILDTSEVPIPGATAKLIGTNLLAITDAQGRFSIKGAPVGKVSLLADGSTSTRTNAVFPFLVFDLLTVSGKDNTVGMPIHLPPLDVGNAQTLQCGPGAQDTILKMKGVPGYEFTVFANSATTPDGKPYCGPMTLSQVASDKVPMPPPNGARPRITGTLQPAGLHFNPPIKTQFPNTEGLAPGTVIEVFSFDHDLEQFVGVGTARVAADGSVIVSDPGFGIPKSGWHFPPPPPPPKTCAINCNDNNECTADSVNTANCTCVNSKLTGGTCGNTPTGVNSCKDAGQCQNGVCTGKNKPDGSSCADGDTCTINDKCTNGACKGDKVPDGFQTQSQFSLAPFQNIRTALVNVMAALKLVPGLNVPDISGSITLSSQDKCCASRSTEGSPVMKATSQVQGQVGVTLLIKDFTPTIPPWSNSIDKTILGRTVQIKYGATFTIDGAVNVQVTRTKDECPDPAKICWSGGLQTQVTISGGVVGLVTNPFLPNQCGPLLQDPCALVGIKAVFQTGITSTTSLSCTQLQLDQIQWSGLAFNLSVQVGEGTIINFTYQYTIQLFDPQNIPIGLTIDLPQ